MIKVDGDLKLHNIWPHEKLTETVNSFFFIFLQKTKNGDSFYNGVIYQIIVYNKIIL